MYLVQILLPLNDNEGRPHKCQLFRNVARELTKEFGGLTAHTRAPAEGLWKKDDSRTDKDEIVIYDVMTEELVEGWWTKFRLSLEKRFHQKQVIVRAQEIRLL
jgi:hypothetical protein